MVTKIVQLTVCTCTYFRLAKFPSGLILCIAANTTSLSNSFCTSLKIFIFCCIFLIIFQEITNLENIPAIIFVAMLSASNGRCRNNQPDPNHSQLKFPAIEWGTNLIYRGTHNPERPGEPSSEAFEGERTLSKEHFIAK